MAQEVLTERTGYVNESVLEGKTIRPGCLGQLRGPICEWRNPTRNDHYYTQSLWRRVFNLPWVKEAMKTKTLFGEADHPEDRLESTLSKTAVVLVDYQERPEEMDYVGTFDILDTPSGRIVRTLAEYGCELGVSSRGRGSLTKINGRNTVDEASYVFGGFDIVALPAVKKARHQFMHESVQFKSVKEDIQTQINECHSIDELNIIRSILENSDYSDLVENINGKISDLSESISRSADNTIVEGLTSDLRKAYAKIEQLENNQNVNTISTDQIADAQLLISTLAENAKMSSQLGDLKVEVHKLSSERDKLTQQINQVTYENESLKNESNNDSIKEEDDEYIDYLLKENSELYDIVDKLKNSPSSTVELSTATGNQDNDYTNSLLEENKRLYDIIDDLKNSNGSNAVVDQQPTIDELRKTIRVKNNRISALEEELDDVYYVNRELSDEIDELAENREIALDKLSYVARRHNKLTKVLEKTERIADNRVSELESYCESLRNSLLASKKSLKIMKNNLNEVSSQSELSDNKIDYLVEKLNNTEEELSKVYDSLDSLSENYDDATEYINRLRQDNLSLKESLEDTRQESKAIIADLEANYNEALDSLDQEVATRNKIIKNYKHSVDEYEAQIDNYEDQLNDYEDRFNHYENQLANYEDQLSSNDDQFNRYENQISNYKDQINTYKYKVNDYQAQLEEVTDDLNNSEEELDDTRKKLSIARKGLKQAKSELNDTQDELDSTQSELVETQDELERVANELTDTQEELSAVQNKLDVTRAALQTTKNELSMSQDELDEATNRLSETQDELTNAHQVIGHHKKVINDLYNDNQDLEAELTNTRNKAVRMHRKLVNNHEAEISEFTDEIDQLQDELSSANEQLLNYKGKYKTLVESYRDLKATYDSTFAELSDLKAEYSESLSENEKTINRISSRYNRVKNELVDRNNYVAQLEQQLQESAMNLTQTTAELNESIDLTNEKADRLQDDYNELLEENAVLRLSYLGQQANKIGVSSNDLVNMLPKNFSVKDIDAIVESHLSRKKRESTLSITSPKLDESKQIAVRSKVAPVSEDLSNAQKTLEAMKLAKK